MSIDCTRMFQNVFAAIGVIDKAEFPISQEELEERLDSEYKHWVPADRRDFWGKLAGGVDLQIPTYLWQFLRNFLREDVKPGVVVELGCGNSCFIPLFLYKGWKVEAVDNSPKVLEDLWQQVSRCLPDKTSRLSLVCTDIETYDFPRGAQLILAKDSLPYCNPAKIIDIWDRAYDSLKRNGRIVGNFFTRPCNPIVDDVSRKVMGSWYTEKAVVEALLSREGYEIETCEYSKLRFRELLFNELRHINFIGKKV